MFRKRLLVLLLLMFAFRLPLPAHAYTVRMVSNGGTVEGTVVFDGVPPRDPVVHSTMNMNYCPKTMPAQRYLIRNKKIQNVVVFLKNIRAGAPAPRQPYVVDNSKCAFVPHMGIGFVGSPLIFRNADPIFHNIHTYMHHSTYYNVSLQGKGTQVTRVLTQTGIMKITCDVHPWMRGYLYVFDNPYEAVTDSNGHFVIRDVPPGTYTVEAWHADLGTVDVKNVNVSGGRATTIEIPYSKTTARKTF
ncbi:MAG: carboxypeptidase regulatory-like domain-containing protein [Nitrospiraceae bacterium]|nr:carboxypeptidase regulatory-like domain-containing protein [Nitrospiraceae bacterium]